MNLHSRLAHLEKDGGPRARCARQRLPHCIRAVDAGRLIIGHPFPVFRELVRLVPRPLLQEIVEADREIDRTEATT